ncbi:site-specific integrase [Rhizobium ruizarguesonis]|uniref:site-specific integrase n=1 Tax=Rhizobium ruizarguesonis TaxID=2081791 RepID=UPI00102F729A|nr:site-specific integrase [Rhizobium ruizarguesonis]TAW57585.1 site-specific integrase [Rhizobium ruizarguesonis]
MAQSLSKQQPGPKVQQSVKREASWLNSRYEDDGWWIADTRGEGKPRYFSFRVLLPNGRLLTDEPKLYATVKETGFWLREGNYTRIEDAERHYLYLTTLAQMAYGVVARGHSSFHRLSSDALDKMCEDSAHGKEALTAAPKLLRTALAQYGTWSDIPDRYKGKAALKLQPLLADHHLPTNWGRRSLKAVLEATKIRLDGGTSLAEPVRDVTVQNVQLVTTLFEAMFFLRHVMAAPSLAFLPFTEGAFQRARSLGATTEPTPIAPPELVFKFLSGCASYLQRNAREVVSRYREILAARGTPAWDKQAAGTCKSEALLIASSCFVLIAAFTARRLEEIKKLKRNCLAGNDQDGWWLNVYIQKSEKKWTWIPIPQIVARAVETLRAFDEDRASDSDLLFYFTDLKSGERRKIKAEERINVTARMVGAEAYQDKLGETRAWHWTTRQFRRFFAVLYIYRWYGKKETIAHHLRHYDLETANDYLRLDAETSATWLKEMENYKLFLAERIAANDDSVTGGMGERLKKYAAKVRRMLDQNVKVVPEGMVSAILRTMSRNHLVLTPKMWVTCTCPRTEDACRRAACRKLAGHEADDVGPDFAAAGPAVCPDCPFALLMDDNVQYLEAEIEELDATAREVSGIFAELAGANVVTMSSYREAKGQGRR